MTRFDFEARTRILRGPGRLEDLGASVRGMEAKRVALVFDPGVADAARRAERLLNEAGAECLVYGSVQPNPTSDDAEALRGELAGFAPTLLAALGGGSTLDVAKAAGFLLSNGGKMRDYQGYGRIERPLPPLICIPTTTGTGSEAQSYCVIADAETRRKMACGAPSAACRVAILDPELALTQPRGVRAASGFDAVAHALETWVCTKRNEFSDLLSREAWRLLSANFIPSLERPDDILPVAAMQWGAYLAGWAIEHSMLGAAHALANPLTRRYGSTHAHALAVMLPHVLRFNAAQEAERYDALARDLQARVRAFIEAARLPATLRDLGAEASHLTELAEDAAEQWTGRHNPRPFDAESALELYRCAF